MSQIESMELIESQVDYITATCLQDKLSDGAEIEHATVLADKLLVGEESRGNRLRKWSSHGFDGFVSGAVAVGRSGRGYLFKLSSHAAREAWRAVYELSTNVSRIDVAATCRLKGPWRDMSLIHQQEVMTYVKQTAPRMRITRIDGGTHGCTLNVGSRQSDAYGRIYDKEAESKREEYQDCWRYEVEFKRDAANRAAQFLDASPLADLAPAAMASQWFGSRAIAFCQVLKADAKLGGVYEVPDHSRTLHWFRSRVAGSARRLVCAGQVVPLLNALGLSTDVLASAGYVVATPQTAKQEGEA